MDFRNNEKLQGVALSDSLQFFIGKMKGDFIV